MQQESQSGSVVSSCRTALPIYRIATPAGTFDSFTGRFDHLPQFQFLPAGEFEQADVVLVDAREHVSDKLPGKNRVVETLGYCGVLPVLLVVAGTGAPDGLLSALSGVVDLQRIELVSESDIESKLVLDRLTMLLDRSRLLMQSDVLRKNAHIVLQAVMQYSNDWMVFKDLDHRFLMASKKFCQAFAKPVDEIIGKNNLEIGTSPELVLGKPGTDWEGYWKLDKMVTDSGESVVLQPLVLADSDAAETREITNKVPLRDEAGNVFGLLVCVSELEPQVDLDGDAETSRARSWERKTNLTESPALLELNNERKRVEALQQASERAVVAKNRFIAAASQ